MQPALFSLALHALRWLPMLLGLSLAAACGTARETGRDCGDCARPVDSPSAASAVVVSQERSSVVGSLVEIVTRSDDGSPRRRGTGVVVSSDGVILTASELVPRRPDATGSGAETMVYADGVALLAHGIAATPGSGSSGVMFLRVYRPTPFTPALVSSARLPGGERVVVEGFRDGPGVGDGNAAVVVAAVVDDEFAAPVGRVGTSGHPMADPLERDRLYVIRIDALEDMVGAPVVDGSGRVRGIVTERVTGGEQRRIVTRVREESVAAIAHQARGR